MTHSPPYLCDGHQRRLNYLRISVTDRCNLRCLYCTPAEGSCKIDHSDILTYEEILRLAELFVDLGVEKIRVTGGEPLVRKDVLEFIPQLAALPKLNELCLTTNGVLLRDNLEQLKSAGLTRLNVSLDSLRPDRYRHITGHNKLRQVWEGIELAESLGLDPIKINVVLIKGVNEDEVMDFARLTREKPYHIRFIEYMPFGAGPSDLSLSHVSNVRVKERISALGQLLPVPRNSYDGPAERFRFPDAPGEIGFISPLSHHFCHQCNRLRLTSTGGLRTCLLSDEQVDLRGPLRKGASDGELEQLFLHACSRKPRAHRLESGPSIHPVSPMSSIGG